MMLGRKIDWDKVNVTPISDLGEYQKPVNVKTVGTPIAITYVGSFRDALSDNFMTGFFLNETLYCFYEDNIKNGLFITSLLKKAEKNKSKIVVGGQYKEEQLTVEYLRVVEE